MNVYDFDGTIYRGDSSADFYFFCLRRHPKLIFFLPGQICAILKFSFGVIKKTRCKEIFFEFLSALDDAESEAELFWNFRGKKIKRWYLRQKKIDDVIVSASPEFLLEPVCKKIGVKLIASKVNSRTGKFYGENCFGKEKVVRFKKEFGESACIENFFSDSKSDYPMTQISSRSFLVKGDSVFPFDSA